MKRLLVLLIVICILISAVSCSPEQPDMPVESSGENSDAATPYVDPVLQCAPARIEAYGDYIYFINESNGMMRYDRASMESSPACVDPTCDGSCLLENSSRSKVWDFQGIVDGELYFTFYDGVSDPSEFAYARMNLVTGRVTEIVRHLASEDPMQKAIVSNGNLYYLRYALKEGGDPGISEDYELYYYRVSVNGGEPEVFCSAQTGDGYRYIYFAEGDLLYMYIDNKYISYHVKTAEERVIYEAPETCYTYSYYGGKIYLVQMDDDAMESGSRLGYLYALDVKTGEAKRLVDDYINRFQVTQDGIYYVLFEERTIYTPRDTEKAPITVNWGADTHFCKHDGTNSTVVYREENMNIWMYATVINGKYYGLVSDFFAEEAEDAKNDRYGWEDYGYCTLNFSTGEVMPWVP